MFALSINQDDLSKPKLTPSEIEVLTLLAAGQSSQQVADNRHCSKRTVDYHLANVYKKLEVSNRVGAILAARRLGLIPLMEKKGELPSASSRLTGAEVEVLELLAKGVDYNKIAEELLVARRTIDFHAHSIYTKLGVNNRIQAINIAVGSGLVENPHWCNQ